MENKSLENEKLGGNKQESTVLIEETSAAKMLISEEQRGEVIEISSDDEETEDMKKPKKAAATVENQSTKALAEALEKQISSMSMELECPVCLNECSPPIFTCLAQHPVCAGCREGLELCAVCREPYNQGMIRHRYAERDFEKLEAARRQLLSLQEEQSKDEVSVLKQLADTEVLAAGDGGQGREMKFLQNKASEVGTEENKMKPSILSEGRSDIRGLKDQRQDLGFTEGAHYAGTTVEEKVSRTPMLPVTPIAKFADRGESSQTPPSTSSSRDCSKRHFAEDNMGGETEEKKVKLINNGQQTGKPWEKRKMDLLMYKARALEGQVEASNNRAGLLKKGIVKAEQAWEGAKQKLRTLEKMQELAVFGTEMPKIVEEIQKCKGFMKPPIGPLGSYIKMKYWLRSGRSGADLRRAVEGELGNLLTCFLCDNSADQQKLYKLLQNMNLSSIPQILTCKFTENKHNIFDSVVHMNKFNTLIDCVEISNANVFNRVVNSSNLHKVVFIPSLPEAEKLLSLEATVPKNLVYARVPGFKVFPAPDFRKCRKLDDKVGTLMGESRVLTLGEKAAREKGRDKIEEALSELRRAHRKLEKEKEGLKALEGELGLVKLQICGLKHKDMKTGSSPPRDFLCDDCKYVTPNHVARMRASARRCTCHPCQLKRAMDVVEV